jgi:hypothetical protein
MKSNQEIDSILLANWYFLSCKKDKKVGCHDVARKYLTLQIKKALSVREKSNTDRASSFLRIF